MTRRLLGAALAALAAAAFAGVGLHAASSAARPTASRHLAAGAQTRPLVPRGAFLVTNLDGRLLVLDAAGKRLRRLPGTLGRYGAWGGLELAADRRHAFVSLPVPDRPGRLYELDLATGKKRRIADGLSPALSPDRRYLAYLSESLCRDLTWTCRTALVIRNLLTGDMRTIPFAEGIVGGNRPELVINWSPEGQRVVLFDRKRLRLVDVATATDIPSQPALTPAYAPVFLDAYTLVVLANCCIGRQQLVTIDIRSGVIGSFAELSAPPEIIRRLKPGLLLTVTASGELALVSRGRTRVIARGITAAAA